MFHCHFVVHVSDDVSLRGSPDGGVPPGHAAHAAAPPDPEAIPRAMPGDTGHDRRGLVPGIKVTPAPGHREPVRIVVRNNLDEPTGVHWRGLEIERYPDGVRVSGKGGRIMPQIAPRDTSRDHLVDSGAGGPQLAPEEGANLRLADDSTVQRWHPLARDGADLPVALREARLATTELGPGETADFAVVPQRPGRMMLEVWLWPVGHGVEPPIDVVARESMSSR